MSPPSDTIKKEEVLQLRIDKPFLELLSAFAAEQKMPISVMIRAWLSERLNKELKLANSSRVEWLKDRFVSLQEKLSEFNSGPVLAIHAFALTPGIYIDPEKVRSMHGALAPYPQSLPAIGRINRLGYEQKREYQDKIVSAGQAFKTGNLEFIQSIDSNKQEILGMALDHGIIEIIRAQVGLLAGMQIPLPYLFKISILRAKGYWLTVNPTLFSNTIPQVDFQEDEFTLQDIIISDFAQVDSESKLAECIKPALDELWHAAGIGRSASFTDGKWNKR